MCRVHETFAYLGSLVLDAHSRFPAIFSCNVTIRKAREKCEISAGCRPRRAPALASGSQETFHSFIKNICKIKGVLIRDLVPAGRIPHRGQKRDIGAFANIVSGRGPKTRRPGTDNGLKGIMRVLPG